MNFTSPSSGSRSSRLRAANPGFTLVEVLVAIAIIGILSLSIPSIGLVMGSARESTIAWQENALNSTYRQYIAAGGAPANSLEEALSILSSHPDFNIQPPTTMTTGEGEVVLTFTEQSFSYRPPSEEIAAPRDNRQLAGTSPLILNVRRAGGTATYGGQDLGFGPMPEFMLMASGGNFTFYNSGGYDNVGLTHSLTDFLSDLEPSADRFNPTSTKTLSLEKNGIRYDLSFILWDNGNQLRLMSVSKYQ